ncbi:transcription elongation factor GreB [Malonomonas rubra DSM 5091]|uniref:Transcription elongation factor GreB n=1 Tax=Malonomonas rubra DSM 5091 TaxID=1122189 RepID=A0A1M6NC13_MALRU|nr:transcription elongation factor GreB [Malonomonas rubra]SHJ93239.1 transcription elongation factor GreB [Malonomonas rubra DSM 5091]
MTQKKIYMTPGCAENLKAELKDLLYKQRPEMVDTVAWAASNGDRSENADYHYGKKRLRQIDGRIRFLQGRLDSAEIVDPVKQRDVAGDRVLFGCTITVENEEGEERTVSIVGEDEIDLNKGRISWVSPLGRALLGNSEGDLITFKSPRGVEELEIVKVDYISLD